jgi:hypothetical protein
METRFEVAQFTATVLRELIAGQPAPEIPPGVDDSTRARLVLVRDALIDLVARYQPAVIPV